MRCRKPYFVQRSPAMNYADLLYDSALRVACNNNVDVDLVKQYPSDLKMTFGDGTVVVSSDWDSVKSVLLDHAVLA